LPVLIRVERGDLREELGQMCGKSSGIIVMLRVLAGSISALSDGKAAYDKAACDYGCECFEVFHSSVCCWFNFSALAALCRQWQIGSQPSLLARKPPSL